MTTRKQRAQKHARNTWECPACGKQCRGNGGKTSHQRAHLLAAGLGDAVAASGTSDAWRYWRTVVRTWGSMSPALQAWLLDVDYFDMAFQETREALSLGLVVALVGWGEQRLQLTELGRHVAAHGVLGGTRSKTHD